MRWRLDLSYDGTNFSGWATQPGLRTVQGEIEKWLPKILRHSEPISLTVAGRTDAGVHATAQVAHFDFDSPADFDLPQTALRRLSRVLSDDILIRDISQAPSGFDSRFSAIWRRYSYRIWDENARPDPRKRYYHCAVRGKINVELFNQGGACLLGLRDFAAFSKHREGATTIRTLHQLTAKRLENGTIEVEVQADAFCHSMVRSLVGALVAVGTGQRDLNWLARVAASKQRHPEVLVMKAKGLTLTAVGYPPDDQLAERAKTTRTKRKPIS